MFIGFNSQLFFFIEHLIALVEKQNNLENTCKQYERPDNTE